jgi:hypothetical protein
MEIGREDVGIFINGPVLYDGFCSVMDLKQLVKPAVKEIDLQVKTPAWHILVEIHEVRIVVHIFELRDPPVVLAQHFR